MLVKSVSVQHLRAYSSFRTGSVLQPCCTDAPPWPHALQSFIFLLHENNQQCLAEEGR